MTTRAEWQQLAEDRILDAQAHLVPGVNRWSAAFYLIGYAVECELIMYTTPSASLRQLSATLLFAAIFLTACAGPKALAQEKPLPEQIAKDDVQRIKQATVLLHVTMPDGTKASGSGFFALQKGVVITNAHVLGMLGTKSTPPKEVEVVLNSGEAKETKLKGTVLGVDRTNDLGVVRVEGANLPAPLALETKRELGETQRVYIFGFPFGMQLGKNITVSTSSVSSLRTFGTDTLQQIQVNGGIHQGNSGGPVVNSAGSVVGVSVSVIRGTQINFAIPVHFVSSLEGGRVSDSQLGEPFLQGGKVQLPVKFTCLDPLNQIKEVRVDVWTGKPGAPLSPSTQEPKAGAGDGKRQSFNLTYGKYLAGGDVTVPTVPAGQVCWLQPVIVSTDGKSRYGFSVKTPTPLLPVERKPAQIAFDINTVKERTVKIKTTGTETFTAGKISEVATDQVEVDLLEVIAPDPQGAMLRLAFVPTTKIVSEVNGRPTKMHAETHKMLRALPPSFILVEGGGLKSRISLKVNPKLPADLQRDFMGAFAQMCNSLEAVMLPIPKRTLQPGDRFGTKIPLIVGGFSANDKPPPGKNNTTISKTVDLVLTCTYEGTRKRNDRDEALITVTGIIKGRSKGTERVSGDVAGKFGVDVQGGFISLAQIKILTESEGPGGEFRFSFALDVDLERQPGNPLKITPPAEKKPAPTS